jgi:hypothetical protein
MIRRIVPALLLAGSSVAAQQAPPVYPEVTPTTPFTRSNTACTSSLATLNATDMFASITFLSVIGVGLVYLLRAVEARLLHFAASAGRFLLCMSQSSG